MGIMQWISGHITLEMTCADISQTIKKLNEQGIEIFDTSYVSELTVLFRIRQREWKKLSEYAQKRGITLKIIRSQGFLRIVRSLLKRRLLLAELVLVLFAAWFVPGRIMVVEVEGNNSVPTRLILEAAQESGIHFGAVRRDIRSEKLKNALLSRIPQLQWAGVNTYGSRAVITVRERSEEEGGGTDSGVCSIVADRDAVILSCTATRGNALVVPGQAVRKGQTLISGYTDCGLSIEATRAEGEIVARTERDLEVITPLNWDARLQETGKETKYSLRIGKKRINFYKGSGIYSVSCVKMYTEYVLTLPGGFPLPVALMKETVVSYELAETERLEETVTRELSDFAAHYLNSCMIAGVITDRTETLHAGAAYHLTGHYACREMIGRVKPEEIGVYNGKTD